MNDHTNDQHWKKLCEALLEEKDPVQLQHLATKLNRELEDREERMRQARQTSSISKTEHSKARGI